MIARAAIDARALIDLLSGPPRSVIMGHAALTAAIRDHSVLMVTGDNDEQELREAIKRQPEPVRVMWVQTLRQLQNTARYRRIRPEMAEAVSVLCDGELPGSIGAHIDYVVVGADVAVRRGFDHIGYERVAGEPEQVPADAVSHCPTITRMQLLRERANYPSGTDRTLIWREVFAPLAAASAEVTLLDRYLVKGMLAPGASLKHVDWILDRLDASMTAGGSVRVLAEIPDLARSASDYDGLIRRSPLGRPRTNIRYLRVVLAPWSASSERGPHNRHMRFSCGSAIGVEEGFDRFRTTTIKGVDGFTWKHHTNGDTIGNLAGRENFVLQHERRIDLLLS